MNIEQLTVNSIRMLGVQAVNKANSGHPGIVLGAAPIMYTLFKKHLKYNPKNPQWMNRDRFVLSAGHGSALLYSTLIHAGYPLTIADLQQFRQITSHNTHGHPEYNLKYGIEATTGPLGQGLAMAVGMAMGEAILASKLTNAEAAADIIDHQTYVLCGDGDLQEGVAHEALALAGHLQLKKLTVIFDSNDVQLDTMTSLTTTIDWQKWIEAYGWNYLLVADGNDLAALDEAFTKAKMSLKPTFIEVKTIIGFGATKANSSAVHGAALGKDITTVMQKLKWTAREFTIPATVVEFFTKTAQTKGQTWEKDWAKKYNNYIQLYPEDKVIFDACERVFPTNAEEVVHNFDWKSIRKNTPEATRVSSGRILETVSPLIFNLCGGSADLTSSTKAKVQGPVFSKTQPANHIMFGVREFAMGCIVNGLVLHGGLYAFGSTFLIFSDYMKGALRLAALMGIPSFYIFTHDSIAVGEDGPTHQPVEQLAMLQLIPNFAVFRPADCREMFGAYNQALSSRSQPLAIIASRQDLPLLEHSCLRKAQKGAYIVDFAQENKKITAVIYASGSEVSLAIAVKKAILEKHKTWNIQVVSCPAWYLLEQQNAEYKSSIFPENVLKIAIELGTATMWYEKLNSEKDLIIKLDKFGKSAKMEHLLEEYGFTSEQISAKIILFIKKKENE